MKRYLVCYETLVEETNPIDAALFVRGVLLDPENTSLYFRVEEVASEGNGSWFFDLSQENRKDMLVPESSDPYEDVDDLDPYRSLEE